MTSTGWKYRSAPLRASLLASLVLAMLGAGPAAAHDGEQHESLAEQAEAVAAVLGDAEPARDDLLRIEPEKGAPVLTHGPDLRAYEGGQPGFRPGDPERAPVCATDHYQHFVYAYPSGPMPADAAAEIAEIRSIVQRMNFVLNADSLASGGGSADYKVLCDSSGRIRVDTLAVTSLEFGAIIDAVRGIEALLDHRADYTIFLDAANVGWCGIGTYIGDESAGAANANNDGGGYGAIERGCWNTTAPMHENGHNQGAVQYSSPSSTGLGGHCNEDYDVMCYSPDGGDLRQSGTVLRCDDRIRFDCGHDDYFDSAPEPGEYLDTHWNMGSPANRFIRFSEPAGEAPPPAEGVPEIDAAAPAVDHVAPGVDEVAPEIDEVAPELVILQRPFRTVRSPSRSRMVKFKFDAYEPAISYSCRLDDSAWSECESPHELRVRRGRHVFRVRALDEAGNSSPVKRLRFRLLAR